MRALITGASRGIGQQMATLMAMRGDDVIATYRPSNGVKDAPAGMDPQAKIRWQALDVTDPSGVQALAQALNDQPIDLLVCNAGVFLDRDAHLGEGYSVDIWAQSFAVNVIGIFSCVEAFLPLIARAPRPRIALIASNMGAQARAPGGSYAYRASKAAAINLGRNLARDLAPRGIAVGIYHPGWVRTDMGGPGADIDVATSARDLLARFDALDMATSGQFTNHNGQPLPL
jgi:NAD(P)-dependent dehydrogenase (short-subunit alcohol dehydrogenase family)